VNVVNPEVLSRRAGDAPVPRGSTGAP
jgi:hypothetical protein